MTKLLFIFSLPRSGSTLLQRLLASHPEIDTCSEPWLLLPLFFTLKPEGMFTKYSHETCYKAFEDFISQMPHGKEDYYREVGLFAKSLYQLTMNKKAKYFIDKTPRYYLIIPEISRAFQDAKYIFLFRNPLEVLASIITTWRNGRLRLERHYIDLFQGPRYLKEGYENLKDKAIKVNYEKLVIEPVNTLNKIFEYLELNFDESIIHQFHKINFKGRMGNHVGSNQYKQIDKRPLEKWKSTLNTRLRKKIALNYLNEIGITSLKTFGYNFDNIKQELEKLKISKRREIRDRYDLFIGCVFRMLEIPIFKKKMKNWSGSRQKFIIHS